VAQYEIITLSDDETERLQRCYEDLMSLSECKVPSVRAAAREALASVAQALNGQGLRYELYTNSWND
jgi:signal transduction histidine kinase